MHQGANRKLTVGRALRSVARTPVLAAGHTVALLQCGAEYFPALCRAIDSATTEVRLETYIFHFDRTGEQVAQALEAAALRGVAVYVVADGIGTQAPPGPWAERLAAAGVRWHRFAPVPTLGWLVPRHWRRLHRKLCVVDGRTLFCGGINVQDDFFDLSHGWQVHPRLDFALRLRGPLVVEALTSMERFWWRIDLAQRLGSLHLREARQTFAARKDSRFTDTAAASLQREQPGVAAALVLRDNLVHRTRIERAYRKAIAEARSEVWIANAYFLPGGKLRRALIHAARRGVRVRLLVQGRYEYFWQFHGAKPVLQALLAAGVEVYEYHSGFLHAKVAVIDGHWMTVGSSNLDPLSLLLAREANVVLEDATLAGNLRTRLESAQVAHARALDLHAFRQRPWREKALDWLAYGLMRTVLFLTGRRY